MASMGNRLSAAQKRVDNIRSMKEAGKFGLYIDEIVFPHFKNLERGLSVSFDFPVTALVGQNGTNKSSILRALQSCPDQNSISDYWFDTDLDHIVNEPNDRQRYIHRYKVPSGNTAEVIKMRVQKESRGSDYFETAKPRISDGMRKMPEMIAEDEPYRVGTRWRPINKEVVYIDFRAQLPAFDILMSYQNRYSKRDAMQRKSLVRLRSRRLDKVFRDSEQSSTVCGTERLLSGVVALGDEELDDVKEILGRRYKSIKLVKHDFFDYEGWTAKLITSDLDYSEAFAGSGEFAAVSIVHALHAASEESLILLDEPETSLHPGAQTALCEFLLKMCQLKRLQIVMATHSGVLVQSLPSDGRKLLGILPGKKCVSLLSSSASLDETFLRIGADFARDSIFVEDRLAAEFLNAALREKGSDAIGSVAVKTFPGGAQTIITSLIPILAELDSEAMVVLDGDQEQNVNFDLPIASVDDCLKALKEFGISKKHIPMNGGDGDNQRHCLERLNKVLAWIETHVRYLPGGDPESLLLEMIGESHSEARDADGIGLTSKEIWIKKAERAYSKCKGETITSDEVFCYQKIELAKAISEERSEITDAVIRSLQRVINEVLDCR